MHDELKECSICGSVYEEEYYENHRDECNPVVEFGYQLADEYWDEEEEAF